METGEHTGIRSRNIVIRTLRGLARRTFERFQEWRFGIRTEACIGTKELGITDTGCHHYAATSYIRFYEIMKRLKLRPGKEVFADIGSGLGRVVVLAASFPFRRVIGVEISKQLDSAARDNLRNASERLRCKHVDLECVDARKWKIPTDLSVVYLWSPFDESILSPVFANLRRSVEESPREMTIIYTCPPDHPCLDRMKHELHWLKQVEDGPLSSHVRMVIFKYAPPRTAQPGAFLALSFAWELEEIGVPLLALSA